MKKCKKFYAILASVLTSVMLFGMYPGTVWAAPEDAPVPSDEEITQLTEEEPGSEDWQDEEPAPEDWQDEDPGPEDWQNEELTGVGVAYKLYIAGTQVTSGNMDAIANFDGVEVEGNGFITFDPSTNTLKMKDVCVYGNAATYKTGCPINYNGTDDFKIEVEGTCILMDYIANTNTSPVRENYSTGIFVGAVYEETDDTNAGLEIVVAEEGTLALLPSSANGSLIASSGGIIMRGDGNLTLGGSGEISMFSGKGVFSVGIYSNGTATVNDDLNIMIVSADTAVDIPIYCVYGIYAREFTVNGGKVEIQPGKTNAVNAGISVSVATINGGELLVKNDTTESSVGISSAEGFHINGGSVEVSVSPDTTTGVALSDAPVFADGIGAIASVNSDGSEAVDFVPDDVQTYRWFKAPFTRTPVTEIFEDVKDGDWYVKAVQYVYDRKIMSGKGSVFGANDKIKREEFTQLLYNHIGKPDVTGENPFGDVEGDKWYANSVLWAKQNNIAAGKGTDKQGKTIFGVGQNITREEMAVMLYKYAKLRGYKLETSAGIADGFKDTDKISTWSKEAMEWAITQGIMSGKGAAGAPKSEFSLDPQGNATRAECASMVKNLLERNK